MLITIIEPEKLVGPLLVTRDLRIVGYGRHTLRQASAEGCLTVRRYGFDLREALLPWSAIAVESRHKKVWAVAVDDAASFSLSPVELTNLGSYVAGWLLDLWGELDELSLSAHEAVTCVTFSGGALPYDGSCRCRELVEGSLSWGHLHAVGEFPLNCFQCSCGKRWYYHANQRWLQVLDDELWADLLRYNGLAMKLTLRETELDTFIYLETAIRAVAAAGDDVPLELYGQLEELFTIHNS